MMDLPDRCNSHVSAKLSDRAHSICIEITVQPPGRLARIRRLT